MVIVARRSGITTAYDINLFFTGAVGTTAAGGSGAVTNFTTVATTAFAGLDLHGSTSTDVIREIRAFARVQGTVTGTTPTLDLKFQDSTNPTTGYTDMGIAFPTLTTQMLLATSGETVPSVVLVRTRPGRRYVRLFGTPAGTSAVFNGVSVVGVPLDTPPA